MLNSTLYVSGQSMRRRNKWTRKTNMTVCHFFLTTSLQRLIHPDYCLKLSMCSLQCLWLNLQMRGQKKWCCVALVRLAAGWLGNTPSALSKKSHPGHWKGQTVHHMSCNSLVRLVSLSIISSHSRCTESAFCRFSVARLKDKKIGGGGR